MPKSPSGKVHTSLSSGFSRAAWDVAAPGKGGVCHPSLPPFSPGCAEGGAQGEDNCMWELPGMSGRGTGGKGILGGSGDAHLGEYSMKAEEAPWDFTEGKFGRAWHSICIYFPSVKDAGKVSLNKYTEKEKGKKRGAEIQLYSSHS